MAHSIARLSPKYARDRYRFLSLGTTESSWWDHQVLDYHVMDGPLNTRLLTLNSTLLKWIEWMTAATTTTIPSWLKECALWLGCWLSGFSKDVIQNIRNPGFYDAWPTHHVTLHNPAYFGLFKAKLDWTLIRNLNLTHRWFGNAGYKLSDHQWLMIQVDFDASYKANPYEYWSIRRNYWRNLTV
ncbi:hypothetical protein BJ944DRAFT_274225 [Cunninghamella echinulata]|nr:hypothetical protein BJ944DRAFT_274225 [Cunninghamella echinulata]